MIEFHEFKRDQDAMKSTISILKKIVAKRERDFSEKHCPVKVGWIIENHRIRIKIRKIIPLSPAYWDAQGFVLTKRNARNLKYSGFHSIKFPSNFETNERSTTRVVEEK